MYYERNRDTLGKYVMLWGQILNIKTNKNCKVKGYLKHILLKTLYFNDSQFSNGVSHTIIIQLHENAISCIQSIKSKLDTLNLIWRYDENI